MQEEVGRQGLHHSAMKQEQNWLFSKALEVNGLAKVPGSHCCQPQVTLGKLIWCLTRQVSAQPWLCTHAAEILS